MRKHTQDQLHRRILVRLWMARTSMIISVFTMAACGHSSTSEQNGQQARDADKGESYAGMYSSAFHACRSFAGSIHQLAGIFDYSLTKGEGKIDLMMEYENNEKLVPREVPMHSVSIVKLAKPENQRLTLTASMWLADSTITAVRMRVSQGGAVTIRPRSYDTYPHRDVCLFPSQAFPARQKKSARTAGITFEHPLHRTPDLCGGEKQGLRLLVRNGVDPQKSDARQPFYVGLRLSDASGQSQKRVNIVDHLDDQRSGDGREYAELDHGQLLIRDFSMDLIAEEASGENVDRWIVEVDAHPWTRGELKQDIGLLEHLREDAPGAPVPQNPNAISVVLVPYCMAHRLE